MYSVIIPSIGRINYLNELLESIYMQTLLPEEVIIVLDNNKKCKDIVNLIKKKNSVKFLFFDNLTTPQKRNKGIGIAKSENIIFSDDDDYWEINKGELTIESLRSCQVVCHAYSKFGSLNLTPKYHLGKDKMIVPLFYLMSGDNIFGGGSSIAGKKEIFLTVPFNSELYSEDYDWWIKILLAEIKVEYIPKSLVRYRVHGKNMTSNYKKVYFYNSKLFNRILIKSFILFCTFFNGYLRLIIKVIIRLFIKNIVTAKNLLLLKYKK